MAGAGFTVFAPDAPHHGSRHSEVLGGMPDALTLDGHRVLLRILREARDEIPKIVDHVLAQGHPRVAIAGVSMGAFIALAAATVEPRLASVVSILGTPDWTPRDGDVPPDLVDAVTESPHLQAEKFAPRPLLFLNGNRDDSVRPGPTRVFVARLRPLYAARGGRIVHREYDTPHYVEEHLWADMWMTSIAFLARTVG